MDVLAIVNDLGRRGVRIWPEGNNLVVQPAERLTNHNRNAIRAYKPEPLAVLSVCNGAAAHARDRGQGARKVDLVAEALSVLNRLKIYSLPAGHMSVVRELAERMRDLTDPTEILAALLIFERELIELGGSPDPELDAVVTMVERTFTGARLVEVNTKKLVR